ncbi:MAG: Nramp family divalent metal transporter [Planctomycetes bacterium]|nr:Nramp family divalent metal transporter [Planctomycetota bacterium]
MPPPADRRAGMNDAENPPADDIVPDNVIPPGSLPPLKYKDLPEPIPLRRMVGPSLILAGLALGSGEFILWPYITYKTQFVFFWACIVGVATQYVINMEISRWTLATGESAVTGFIRLSKWFAWALLAFNLLPWIIPAWAKGAGQIVSWLIWGPQLDAEGDLVALYSAPLAIFSLFACGVILTLGPVIYETIERVQMLLVTLIVVLVIGLTVYLALGRPDAVWEQLTSTVTFGAPRFVPEMTEDITPALLLGALAFAGAGGTLNLGQSNYVKEKGYGMGRYIGRITSPITGREEPVTEFGYHFPATAENLARWRVWWRRAGMEHFLNFFVTCVVCLVMLSLISYILFYDAEGNPVAGTEREDLGFVWDEGERLAELIGPTTKLVFLVMGVAILLTTEFGVLDAASRISCDLVKVAWLRESGFWSESRLYYAFLWGMILLATAILLLETTGRNLGALFLFKLTSAMNGGVMFLYCAALLYLNTRCLPPAVRMSRWRQAAMLWAVLFFGFFAVWAVWSVTAGMLR